MCLDRFALGHSTQALPVRVLPGKRDSISGSASVAPLSTFVFRVCVTCRLDCTSIRYTRTKSQCIHGNSLLL
jgi:hypothetical protein